MSLNWSWIQLETTAERIKAVDLGAAMVEEMLKQGSVNNGVKVDRTLTACVFLGFEADPSLNISSRIRGPNVSFSCHIILLSLFLFAFHSISFVIVCHTFRSFPFSFC